MLKKLKNSIARLTLYHWPLGVDAVFGIPHFRSKQKASRRISRK